MDNSNHTDILSTSEMALSKDEYEEGISKSVETNEDYLLKNVSNPCEPEIQDQLTHIEKSHSFLRVFKEMEAPWHKSNFNLTAHTKDTETQPSSKPVMLSQNFCQPAMSEEDEEGSRVSFRNFQYKTSKPVLPSKEGASYLPNSMYIKQTESPSFSMECEVQDLPCAKTNILARLSKNVSTPMYSHQGAIKSDLNKPELVQENLNLLPLQPESEEFFNDYAILSAFEHKNSKMIESHPPSVKSMLSSVPIHSSSIGLTAEDSDEYTSNYHTLARLESNTSKPIINQQLVYSTQTSVTPIQFASNPSIAFMEEEHDDLPSKYPAHFDKRISLIPNSPNSNTNALFTNEQTNKNLAPAAMMSNEDEDQETQFQQATRTKLAAMGSRVSHSLSATKMDGLSYHPSEKVQTNYLTPLERENKDEKSAALPLSFEELISDLKLPHSVSIRIEGSKIIASKRVSSIGQGSSLYSTEETCQKLEGKKSGIVNPQENAISIQTTARPSLLLKNSCFPLEPENEQDQLLSSKLLALYRAIEKKLSQALKAHVEELATKLHNKITRPGLPIPLEPELDDLHCPVVIQERYQNLQLQVSDVKIHHNSGSFSALVEILPHAKEPSALLSSENTQGDETIEYEHGIHNYQTSGEKGHDDDTIRISQMSQSQTRDDRISDVSSIPGSTRSSMLQKNDSFMFQSSRGSDRATRSTRAHNESILLEDECKQETPKNGLMEKFSVIEEEDNDHHSRIDDLTKGKSHSAIVEKTTFEISQKDYRSYTKLSFEGGVGEGGVDTPIITDMKGTPKAKLALVRANNKNKSSEASSCRSCTLI